MAERFDIYLVRTLGAIDDVAPRLAAGFGIPLERAFALIAAAPVRIKANASLAEARTYEDALRAAGGECERRLVGGSAEALAPGVDSLDPRAVAPTPPGPRMLEPDIDLDAAPLEPAFAAPISAPARSSPPASFALADNASPQPIAPASPASPATSLPGRAPLPERGLLGDPLRPGEGAPVAAQKSRIRNTGLSGLAALLVFGAVVGLIYVKCRAPRMGGLIVKRVGGAGSGRPALILLHGYGAPGGDLVRLGEEMLETHPDIQIIVPEAPYDAGAGHAWYVKSLDEADSSREKLLRLIRAVTKTGTLPESVIIAGFSQGGIMAMDAALNYPETLGGVAVLSGGDEKEFGWQRLLETNSRLKVFISHGKNDDVLGYRSMERFAGELEGAGYQVELLLFEGGHAIPEETRAGLARFITAVLGG